MFVIDLSTEFGALVERRLRDEEVVWLTTVRTDGIPQPNPVWFLWDGASIIVLSQPHAKKVSHIRSHPQVALNFNSTPEGYDVVIITGEAQIETTPLDAPTYTAYIAKYRKGIESIQMTPESMTSQFSTIIRITPRHLRGLAPL